MTDAEFDVLLRRALLETTRREYAHILEADDLPLPAFSRRYLRQREKFLADPFGWAKRKTRHLWKKVMRAAACLLLAAGIAFGGLMVFSPEARAWVARVFTEWRETHTKYTFTGDLQPEADVGVWRPSYVPEGFEECNRLDTPGMGYVSYRNAEGIYIHLTYALLDQGTEFSIDNEHSDYSEAIVGSCPAELFTAKEMGKSSHLIWQNESGNVAFHLSSQLAPSTLIRIAENLGKR